jgi:putative heme utilization carrier protein HutX
MNIAAQKPDLASILAANPGAVVETVAKEHGVTTREVLEALPAQMRRFASGDNIFVEAMKDMATWGDVTLIVHTDDGIWEFSGAVPPGDLGHGYFNLMGRTGLHGHLRHERCAGLCFLERPFMGVGVRSVPQCRRWHHAQGVRRPRREARTESRPDGEVSCAGGKVRGEELD